MKNNNKMSKLQSLVLSFVLVAGGTAPAFAGGSSHHNGGSQTQTMTGGDQIMTGGNQTMTGGNQVMTGGSQTMMGGSQVVGGQNTLVGGQTMGSQSVTNSTSISTPRQIYPGMAPAVFNAPAGVCGEGFGLSAGGPFSALGGGMTWQGKDCMDRNDGKHLVDVGTVLATQPDLNLRKQGKQMIGLGLRALMEKSPTLKGAVTDVAVNTQLDCVKKAEQADDMSIIMMTQELTCDADGKVVLKPKAVEKPKSSTINYPGREF